MILQFQYHHHHIKARHVNNNARFVKEKSYLFTQKYDNKSIKKRWNQFIPKKKKKEIGTILLDYNNAYQVEIIQGYRKKIINEMIQIKQ